jgi:rare lipoprotein A
MSFPRRIALPSLILAVITACTTDETADRPDAPTTAELTAEEIAQLQEQYPRLQDQPLPQPKPSESASPNDVPDRLSTAVPDAVLETITGQATFYANKFEGRRTASGIPFRQNQMVAAHRAYPFGTILRVTNTRNDRSVNVRVVDRGPFGASAARGTVIDLSRRAAEQLDFINAGRAQVQVEVLEWGRGIGSA